MTANQAQQQKTVLTDDGELRDIGTSQENQAADLRGSKVYCIHCGTPNRSVASFCRSCGQPLEDQADPADHELSRYSSIQPKSKHSDLRLSQPESRPAMTVPMMLYSLIQLALIGGMIVSLTHRTNNIILPIGIITAWILVVAFQQGAINPHGNRVQMTVPMMVFNVIKVAFVGGYNFFTW
jgi:hypothetical protein